MNGMMNRGFTMRKTIATAVLAIAVTACTGGGGEKVVSTPTYSAQLAQCPALSPLAKPSIARTRAITVPAGPLAALVASDARNIAVARSNGGTSCVDVRLMSDVNGLAALQADRFVGFDWKGFTEEGFRNDGYSLVDRTSGLVTETGGKPVFSPSGRMFAAAYQSESAFAALEGFGVWKVMPTGPMRVAVVDDLPEMLDWRVDSWGGETCVNLSAVSFAMVPVGTKSFAGVARDKFVARQVGAGWDVKEADANGC